MATLFERIAYERSDAMRAANGRPAIERHPYGACERWSIAHTHCPTCGDPSVMHNRADCKPRRFTPRDMTGSAY